MKKLRDKVVADLFIMKALEKGADPYIESRKFDFGLPSLTASIRRHVEKWECRRLYFESRDDATKAGMAEFARSLPVFAGVAVERARISKQNSLGYRVYCPESGLTLFEITDAEIPLEHRSSEERKMLYAAFWATMAKSIYIKEADASAC